MASKKKTAEAEVANTSILEAHVPDITTKFVQVLQTAIMVPLDHPKDADCIWGLPTIFWGLSGIAKSDRVKQAAGAAALPCEVIMPGQKQPDDFSGIFVPLKEGGVSMECMLPQVRRLNKAGQGILFVDEVSCAAPATQGAMLGMVNDRVVADEQFAPGIRVLLAANPPSYSAGGWSLEAPFANRMAHFQVGCPTTTEWIAYMMGQASKKSLPVQTLDPKMSKEVLIANWNSSYSYTLGQVSGYIRDRQASLHQQPLPNNPQAGYCWASPRTWKFATRAIATIKALAMDPTLEHLFVAACVGEGPAQEFMHWVRNSDLPRPEQVLIKGWEPDVNRLDVTLAVTASVGSYVINLDSDTQAGKEEREDMAGEAWKYVMALINKGIPDIAMPLAQTLTRAQLCRSGHENEKLKAACAAPVMWMAKNGWLQYVTTEMDN